jgi:hypothetical protein
VPGQPACPLPAPGPKPPSGPTPQEQRRRRDRGPGELGIHPVDPLLPAMPRRRPQRDPTGPRRRLAEAVAPTADLCLHPPPAAAAPPVPAMPPAGPRPPPTSRQPVPPRPGRQPASRPVPHHDPGWRALETAHSMRHPTRPGRPRRPVITSRAGAANTPAAAGGATQAPPTAATRRPHPHHQRGPLGDRRGLLPRPSPAGGPAAGLLAPRPTPGPGLGGSRPRSTSTWTTNTSRHRPDISKDATRCPSATDHRSSPPPAGACSPSPSNC